MRRRKRLEEKLANQLAIMLARNIAFTEVIKELAELAELCDEWKDFPVERLDEDGIQWIEDGVDRVPYMLERISSAFTPAVFCELANDADREVEDFLLPTNDGLTRIKDAIFGNAREDRMVSLSLE